MRTSLLGGLLTTSTHREPGLTQVHLYSDDDSPSVADLEVSTRGFGVGAVLDINPEDETPIMLKVGLGPVRAFLSSESKSAMQVARALAKFLPHGDHRGRKNGKFGAFLRWDEDDQDLHLRVDLGTPDDGPNWQSLVSVFAKDLILGKRDYTKAEGDSVTRTIYFPEGAYVLKVTKDLSIWKRPRWPWPLKSGSYHWEVVSGADGRADIPIPGKGENSWDCGEDGCSAGRLQAQSFEEAAGLVFASIMRDRIRRAGEKWMPAPPRVKPPAN